MATREETLELIGKVGTGIAKVLASVSPASESMQIRESFEAYLSKLDQINRTEIGDAELNKLIREGYNLAKSMPKCLPPTENCKNEHYNWGLKVQDYMFMLAGEFKKRGYDLGVEPTQIEMPFKLDEQNILKIGFIAVVILIIISLLKK